MYAEQPVGFHVALDHQQSSGDKVAFNRILSNYGNGWDKTTYTFKVPTKGLYSLTLTVMNLGTSTAWAFLKRGSENIHMARADKGHSYNMGMTSTVLILDEGEEISAQYGGGTLFGDQNLHTHFTGFLIQRSN